MESYPALIDAIRAAWLRPSLAPPPSTAGATSVDGSRRPFPTIAPHAASPLDHIEAVAHWAAQTKLLMYRHHMDAPILSSRAFQNGGGPTHMSSRALGGTFVHHANRHDTPSREVPQRERVAASSDREDDADEESSLSSYSSDNPHQHHSLREVDDDDDPYAAHDISDAAHRSPVADPTFAGAPAPSGVDGRRDGGHRPRRFPSGSDDDRNDDIDWRQRGSVVLPRRSTS